MKIKLESVNISISWISEKKKNAMILILQKSFAVQAHFLYLENQTLRTFVVRVITRINSGHEYTIHGVTKSQTWLRVWFLDLNNKKKIWKFFLKAKWVLLVTKWGCLWHQISLSFWKQGCESLMLLGTGWSFQCCINSPQFSKHLIDMHMYTDFFSSYIAFFMYHEFISGCDVSKHYY